MLRAAIVAALALSAAPAAFGQIIDALPVDPDILRDIPEGCILLDDIIVRADQDRATYETNLWHSHIVPYAFDANVTQINRNRMVAAMAEIEAVANIKFIPRTTESNYLYCKSSTGNNSFVGQVGGAQTVNIVSWTYKFIIVHELLHALGMWHEHQRADRSLYVTVNYANMQAGTSGAFVTVPSALVYGPYDFESVMHYDPCSFSVCCPAGSTCGCAGSECYTIEALPQYADQQSLMGQRTYLSDGDKAWLVFAYGERDCNGNSIHDYFDIQSGILRDCNSNGAPDACESGVALCPGDIDGSCATTAADFVILAASFGAAVTPGTSGDLNFDGLVTAADFVILAADFGATCP